MSTSTEQIAFAELVPFITRSNHLPLAHASYEDATAIRVPIDAMQECETQLGAFADRLWIDPAIDGFHSVLTTARSSFAIYKAWKMDAEKKYEDYVSKKKAGLRPQNAEKKWPPRPIRWTEFYEGFPTTHSLGDSSFVARPNQKIVNNIAEEILDACIAFKPAAISIPQLPIVNGAERNAVNRQLAKAAGQWKRSNNFNRGFVLPAIFTNGQQFVGKKIWGKKVDQIRRCMDLAEANTVWIVDSSLADNEGRPAHQKRISELIKMHHHLRDVLDSNTRIIAGPYWAINLILWARGASTNPAVGFGGGHRYIIPGRPAPAVVPKAKLPLEPLKRFAVAEDPLKIWIQKALKVLAPDERGVHELREILQDWDFVKQGEEARNRMAKFYRRWFDEIAECDKDGRNVAVFKTLTDALSIAAKLDPLPSGNQPLKPGDVASRLLGHCIE